MYYYKKMERAGGVMGDGCMIGRGVVCTIRYNMMADGGRKHGYTRRVEMEIPRYKKVR